jgi:hypothetical protein
VKALWICRGPEQGVLLFVAPGASRSGILSIAATGLIQSIERTSSSMNRQDLNQLLPGIIGNLVGSIRTQPAMTHLDRVLLPNRDVVIEIVKRLRELTFPGYFGKQGLTRDSV